MKNLSYYANLLLEGEIHYKGRKSSIVKPNSCSLLGFALELAVKDYLGLEMSISRSRQADTIFSDEKGRHFLEVKSNSSPFDASKCGTIAYAFFVDLEKPLNKQWGYVMPMKLFKEIGYSLNHIKSGTSNGGRNFVEEKTQTVWNYSKNAPHGAKAYKLEDAYLENGAISFEEWFI